jgi:uncharacterized membrane protein
MDPPATEATGRGRKSDIHHTEALIRVPRLRYISFVPVVVGCLFAVCFLAACDPSPPPNSKLHGELEKESWLDPSTWWNDELKRQREIYPERLPEESWLKPSTWFNDEAYEAVRREEEETQERIANFAPFIVMVSFTTALLTLYGSTLGEMVRGWVVRRFSIPRGMQRTLASLVVGVFVAVLVIFALTSGAGEAAIIPTFVLCAVAVIIFCFEMLPTIATDEVQKRKHAMSKIKGVLFLNTVILTAISVIETKILPF